MNKCFLFLKWLSDFFYKKEVRYIKYDCYTEDEQSNQFEMYRQRTIVSG